MIVLKILLCLTLTCECSVNPLKHYLDVHQLHEVKKIVLTKLSHRLEIYNGNKLRFGTDRDRIWRYGIIPYKFSYAFPLDLVNKFEKLVGYVNNSTCVRFRPYRRDVDVDYIEIATYREKLCTVFYGRPTYTNMVHFPDWCISNNKTGLNQLMRLLGFEDMQRHPDRDKYVQILWQNIMPGKEYLYSKMAKELFSEFYGMEYDYHSVSHLGDWEWSINGSKVMIPKIKGVTLGSSGNFSAEDIAKINLFYEWECSLRDYKESVSKKDL